MYANNVYFATTDLYEREEEYIGFFSAQFVTNRNRGGLPGNTLLDLINFASSRKFKNLSNIE